MKGFTVGGFLLIFLIEQSIISAIFASIDLFINQNEMRRIMNLNGELWYIENGIVNPAAVDFEMEILPTVDELYFSWRNRDKIPIGYSIVINYEPPQSAPSPLESIISIREVGFIGPESNEASFSVRSPKCIISQPMDDARIRIRFILDLPSSLNQTVLKLRRRKLCSKMLVAHSDLDSDDDNAAATVTTASNFLGSATNLFYVLIGCLFGFLVITASMIILYFTKASEKAASCAVLNAGRIIKAAIKEGDEVGSSLLPAVPSKSAMVTSTPMERPSNAAVVQRSRGNDSVSSSSCIIIAHGGGKQSRRSVSPSILSKCASGVGASSFTSTGHGIAVVQQQSKSDLTEHIPRVLQFTEANEPDVNAIVKRLTVENSAIQLGQTLLEGTFGEVLDGRLRIQKAEEANRGDQWVEVIIKAVKGKAAGQQVHRFLCESLRFMDLSSHPNVCWPLAAGWTDGGDNEEAQNEKSRMIQYALCYSHDGFGNLKKFLMRCRGADSSGTAGPPQYSLSTQDLVYAALHIIRGLLHLHKFRLLHRDVAARNCLVGRDFSIQICDASLSRDLFPQDYHCLGDNENRPIKWLAMECLERSEFSTASDVWSFGVTLWELTTLAQQPYAEVDPFEMHSYLSADQRLAQPYNCPDELYLLMYCCWNLHPEARPTFGQLLSALEHFYAQLTEYI